MYCPWEEEGAVVASPVVQMNCCGKFRGFSCLKVDALVLLLAFTAKKMSPRGRMRQGCAVVEAKFQVHTSKSSDL